MATQENTDMTPWLSGTNVRGRGKALVWEVFFSKKEKKTTKPKLIQQTNVRAPIFTQSFTFLAPFLFLPFLIYNKYP